MLKRIQEIVANDYPDESLVLPHILSRGEIMLVIAPEKSYKSWFMQQTIHELATGMPFLATYEVVKPLKVGYWQLESTEGAFHRRSIKQDWGNAEVYVDTDSSVTLVSHLEDIRNAIQSYELDVVVFDPLYLLHVGEDNTKEGMEWTLREIKRICVDFKVAAFIVHHEGKPSRTSWGSEVYSGRGAGTSTLVRFNNAKIFLLAKKGKPLHLNFVFRDSEPQEDMELDIAFRCGKIFLPTGGVRGERTQVCVKSAIRLAGSLSTGDIVDLMEREYEVGKDGVLAAIKALETGGKILEIESTDKRKRVWKVHG